MPSAPKGAGTKSLYQKTKVPAGMVCVFFIFDLKLFFTFGSIYPKIRDGFGQFCICDKIQLQLPTGYFLKKSTDC